MGQELWVWRLGPAFMQSGWPQGKEGPSCTPAVDGERLYVEGMAGVVLVLGRRRQDPLAMRLQKDFGGSLPTWSFRESPLVDGDKFVCTPRRRQRDSRGPRQVDWQDTLEEPGTWQSEGFLRLDHRLRLRGAAPVRAFTSRRSLEWRHPTANSSGAMPAPPITRALIVPPRSIAMAWYLPPRPMGPAAGP